MPDAKLTLLQQRLADFEIADPRAALPFTHRLARENGWSPEFGVRVVAEYKRFVFLAMAAGHPVTPSDEVDQAWHLHLAYTRSYWDELCGEVLGRPLHHGPTAGGRAEDEKYHDWYSRTLASYERLFGELPPRDVWPLPDQRFAGRFQRVDRSAHFVVSRRTAAVVAISALFASVAACAGKSDGSGVAGVVLAGILGLVFFMVWLGRGRPGGGGRGGDGGTGFGCSGHDDGSGCGGGGCGGGGCGGD
ncbi:MAG: hypothetical protein NXI31_09515 [bacterium]|nr:hypothetical protein [bacterium]